MEVFVYKNATSYKNYSAPSAFLLHLIMSYIILSKGYALDTNSASSQSNSVPQYLKFTNKTNTNPQGFKKVYLAKKNNKKTNKKTFLPAFFSTKSLFFVNMSNNNNISNNNKRITLKIGFINCFIHINLFFILFLFVCECIILKNYREERAILILCPNRLSQNPCCQFLKKTFSPKTQTLKDLKPSVQEKYPQKVIILGKLEYLERRFVYQSFPGPHPV